MSKWILFLLMALPLKGALVNFTLFNTVALEEQDDSTLLLDGDLVQLILDGGNLTRDPADGTGGLTGDDMLLSDPNNPTALGDGQVDSNTGYLLTQMTYDDTLSGSWAYVRFFNDPVPAPGGFYGQSALFQLPVADGFGNAEFDFMPMITAHMANIAVVPEAGSLVLSLIAGSVGICFIVLKRKDAWI